MASAADPRTAYDPRMSPRGRAVAWLCSLGLVLAIIWALIRVGALPGVNGRADQSPLLVFTPSTESRNASSAPRTVTRTRQQTRQEKPRHETPPPPRTPTPPPEITIDLPGFIHLNREDYARSDVGKLPKQAADAAASGSEVAGSDSGDTPSVAGAAPGGEPLYAAEWYREPRPAETQPYMPAGVQGWGMVACKTIDRYHVEDCRELGESPGSGIARGLRQAAWQFLVRPPRKGGKPLVGVWVRIRFDLIRREAK